MALAESGGGQMLEITGAGALTAQMFTVIDREIPHGLPDIPKLLDGLRSDPYPLFVRSTRCSQELALRYLEILADLACQMVGNFRVARDR